MEGPNYKKIFSDLIEAKFPEKRDIFNTFLIKDEFNAMDVLIINKMISKLLKIDNIDENQRFKAYGPSDIFEILEYQKRNELNNSELSRQLKISRNTIAKWKKQLLAGDISYQTSDEDH
nr:helix-turn-helix domain-containing protein [uncultured Chryseobacterium sp.]